MDIFAAVYDFGASAGALEGYVYHKSDPDQLDLAALPVWVDNLCNAYRHLPVDARKSIQPGCDRTIGRAIRSLVPILGESHELVVRLAALVEGPLPDSPDAFDKQKWFQEYRDPEAMS